MRHRPRRRRPCRLVLPPAGEPLLRPAACFGLALDVRSANLGCHQLAAAEDADGVSAFADQQCTDPTFRRCMVKQSVDRIIAGWQRWKRHGDDGLRAVRRFYGHMEGVGGHDIAPWRLVKPVSQRPSRSAQPGQHARPRHPPQQTRGPRSDVRGPRRARSSG